MGASRQFACDKGPLVSKQDLTFEIWRKSERRLPELSSINPEMQYQADHASVFCKKTTGWIVEPQCTETTVSYLA